MYVKDAMAEGIIGIPDSARLYDAVATMLTAKVSALLTFGADGALSGILSEGDILNRTELASSERRHGWLERLFANGSEARDYARTHGRLVSDVMTRDVITIAEDAPLSDAIEVMTTQHVKRLPVVRDGNVVGILARSDILRALLKVTQSGTVPAGDDTVIKAAVEAEMARHAWSRSDMITLSVDDGVATFTGAIGDERLRRALIVMAENTPGVRAVHDQMAVVEPNSGLLT